jgi:hypothetical protein
VLQDQERARRVVAAAGGRWRARLPRAMLGQRWGGVARAGKGQRRGARAAAGLGAPRGSCQRQEVAPVELQWWRCCAAEGEAEEEERGGQGLM